MSKKLEIPEIPEFNSTAEMEAFIKELLSNHMRPDDFLSAHAALLSEQQDAPPAVPDDFIPPTLEEINALMQKELTANPAAMINALAIWRYENRIVD